MLFFEICSEVPVPCATLYVRKEMMNDVCKWYGSHHLPVVLAVLCCLAGTQGLISPPGHPVAANPLEKRGMCAIGIVIVTAVTLSTEKVKDTLILRT